MLLKSIYRLTFMAILKLILSKLQYPTIKYIPLYPFISLFMSEGSEK